MVRFRQSVERAAFHGIYYESPMSIQKKLPALIE
jgi:hypothetical protein